MGIIAIKTERTQIHFLSDVLVAVASLDLKVPIVVVQRRLQKNDARAKLLFIFTIRFNVLQVCISVSPFVNSLCYL